MTEHEVSLVLALAVFVGALVPTVLLSTGRRGRETDVTRMRRLLELLTDAGDCVRYSRNAHDQMARLGVNPEQVETVLALPASAVRRDIISSVQLERDLGNRTLRVWVREPLPLSGQAYVRRVEWRPLRGSSRPWHALGKVVSARTRNARAADNPASEEPKRRAQLPILRAGLQDGASPE